MGGRKELIGRDILLAAVIGFLITWGSVNAVGQEQVLHAFNGADGIRPDAGVISDAAGNLYGTTWLGGNSQNPCYSNCGVVFKLHLERMARGRRPCCMSSMARTGLSLMLD